LAALTASAQAASLPKDILGEWCGNGDQYDRRLDGEDCGDSLLVIGAQRYSGGRVCVYERVRIKFDPSIPLATKTRPGVWVATIISRCSNEGHKWHEHMTAYFSKGVLWTKIYPIGNLGE
jgi:hypothetical protein